MQERRWRGGGAAEGREIIGVFEVWDREEERVFPPFSAVLEIGLASASPGNVTFLFFRAPVFVFWRRSCGLPDLNRGKLTLSRVCFLPRTLFGRFPATRGKCGCLGRDWLFGLMIRAFIAAEVFRSGMKSRHVCE